MAKIKPITAIEAEKIHGGRLDRRRAYAVDGRRVLVAVNWVDSCSGCTETSDGYNVNGYPRHPKHNCLVGAGCDECGYTGVRRNAAWVPYFHNDR